MAKRRQRRRRSKEQRHAARRAVELASDHSRLVGPVEALAYTREQAAQALGVSLATLDRRVVPTIATVKTEWGARLIPVDELERYEHNDDARHEADDAEQKAEPAHHERGRSSCSSSRA